MDFMGTDSAIFRTLGTKTAMRTDQYNSRWLNGKCPAQPPNDCRHSGLALAVFPQDFRRITKILEIAYVSENPEMLIFTR